MSCKSSPQSSKIETKEKKQLRIAVLDSGYNVSKLSNIKLCDEPKDFTGTGIKDSIGHGTHIANIIADRLKDKNYCILIIKWYDPKVNPDNLIFYTMKAILYAAVKNSNIINYSAGGDSFRQDEKDLFEEAIKGGIIVFVAAGNDSKNLDKDCNYYPACYNLPGMNVVGSLDANRNRVKSSNYGKIVNRWEYGEKVYADKGNGIMELMGGTSQACALQTVKEALKRLE